MFRIQILCAILLAVGACSSTPKNVEPAGDKDTLALPATIEEAVASDFRDPTNRARDQYRHPVETLKFFGLTPEMTIVEISPGAGWYMEILAPLLASKGQYIAAAPPSNAGEYMQKMNDKRAAWLSRFPQLQGKVKTTDFNPPSMVDIAPPGSADMVVTFRNVHNWISAKGEQEAFKAFYKALKPGGTLGVVEHRAPANQKRDPQAKSGYVREHDVIAMAKRAGFKLVAKSEINANPKDTKNHPEGVWTLPPTLRLKEKDREKYLAIGESDRMTLKFVKP
ncbi:MAG: class I SAM-dependent methyltransferase [Bdellovibrionales bacterium]